MRSFALVLSCVAITACGGSSGDTTGSDDSSVADDSTSGDGSNDASSDARADGKTDGSIVDSSSEVSDVGGDSTKSDVTSETPDTRPSVDAGCVAVDATTTDLYVDARVVTSGKGSGPCPFKTILEATAVSLGVGVTRVIHVAGSTPALDYKEAVSLAGSITLLGDGPDKTKISGHASCPSQVLGDYGVPVQCIVALSNGAALEGVTVDGGGGGTPPMGVATTGTAKVYVRSTKVQNAGDGVLVYAPTEMTELDSENNGTSGIECRSAAGSVTLSGGATRSVLANNAIDGVKALPGCALVLTDVDIHDNSALGIHVNGAPKPTTPPSHVFTRIAVTNNGGGSAFSGAGVFSGNLKVRGSTFTGNANYGLEFNASYAVDLGTSADPGKNVFGGSSTATLDACAGVHATSTAATGSVPAQGNAWAQCPPAQGTSCGATSTPDIVYSGSAADPLSTAGCTVGP